MDASYLKSQLAAEAERLGFVALGIAAPDAVRAETTRHEEWLARGYAGALDYLGRRPAQRYDPRWLLPECASVVVVAHSIYTEAPGWPAAGTAKVARYAWGDNYHEVIGGKLAELGRWLDARVDGHRWKATVDTSPLNEKALAVAAGLGWRGGHSLVLTAGLGSYFMLGCLLTSQALPPDAPVDNRCGDCRLCLDACPADALPAPGVLDASRCLSYLNSTRRGDPASAPTLDGWLYGCDACQQACPYNSAPPVTAEPRVQPRPGIRELTAREVLDMPPAEFTRRFAGTVLEEYGLMRLQASAALVAGPDDRL
ncbi:tRNA epoxyqueuosine(34) reductase QueG [bacterium]|nr:tRNA epoxyqueuosine(34) reductase QueG [bacterium]